MGIFNNNEGKVNLLEHYVDKQAKEINAQGAIIDGLKNEIKSIKESLFEEDSVFNEKNIFGSLYGLTHIEEKRTMGNSLLDVKKVIALLLEKLELEAVRVEAKDVLRSTKKRGRKPKK